jgi:ubiquitin-activating enzyme E1 C
MVNEAVKLATKAHPILSNHMTYNGHEGVYSHVVEFERKMDCLVCGVCRQLLTIPLSMTVRDVRALLSNSTLLQLARPSLRTAEKTIYMHAPPALELATRSHLERPLHDFLSSDHRLFVTDPTLPCSIELTVHFCAE